MFYFKHRQQLTLPLALFDGIGAFTSVLYVSSALGRGQVSGFHWPLTFTRPTICYHFHRFPQLWIWFQRGNMYAQTEQSIFGSCVMDYKEYWTEYLWILLWIIRSRWRNVHKVNEQYQHLSLNISGNKTYEKTFNESEQCCGSLQEVDNGQGS